MNICPVNFSGNISDKSKKIENNKELIRSVIGKEYAVAKEVEDLSGFASIKEVFKPFPSHYGAFEGDSNTGLAVCKNYTHHIGLNYDDDKNISQIRVYDTKRKDVGIYDENGNMLRHYSPEESLALMKYKHDSKNFHKVMRYNEPVKNEEEVKKDIETISNLFKFNYKTNKAEEDFVTYRALDSKALKEIMEMPEDGMIYTEPSILSVATNKKSVLQFMNPKNCRHILRLKVKEGARFINLDEASAGRIIYPQMPENELIFKPGSKILITNRHADGGFIDAELIEG